MKILILTNIENEESIDDITIAKGFKEDGHQVTISWVDYDEKLDEDYDIIIRRDTYVEEETKVEYYSQLIDKLQKRLENKVTVNLSSIFDGKGKQYLAQLYHQGYPVIPTLMEKSEIELIDADEFIMKNIDGYSGMGQKELNKAQLKQQWKEGGIAQPKIDFISEVQFYYVNETLEYALEFTPCKFPLYPKPTIYIPKKEEKKRADSFAQLDKGKCRVQRIDFLKTRENELLLLEIEDSAPNLDLQQVSQELRNKFIYDFKQAVYEYVKEKKREEKV